MRSPKDEVPNRLDPSAWRRRDFFGEPAEAQGLLDVVVAAAASGGLGLEELLC